MLCSINMFGLRNVNNLYREIKKKKPNNPVTRILQIAVFHITCIGIHAWFKNRENWFSVCLCPCMYQSPFHSVCQMTETLNIKSTSTLVSSRLPKLKGNYRGHYERKNAWSHVTQTLNSWTEMGHRVQSSISSKFL